MLKNLRKHVDNYLFLKLYFSTFQNPNLEFIKYLLLQPVLFEK